ncbi:MAG TPA: S8 family serine peptidase [Methylomirabilota bacterium]|nr:S8 family serine peptidase [Methylomirabilota bacterium]
MVRPVERGRPLDQALLQNIGYRVARTYRAGWYLLDTPEAPRASRNDDAARLKLTSQKLQASGLFAHVDLDRVVSVQGEPNDAAFRDGRLWGLRNTGQNSGIAGADVNALPAWNLTTGSTNVIVAVIDTGISSTHADLHSQLWVNAGEIPNNGIDDDSNGYIDDVHGINAQWPTNSVKAGDTTDDNRHGTHCAGTIGAAANNGYEHVGVAWNVRLMACKFLSASGFGYDSDGVECIEYAVANDARVLSCSWGGFGFSQILYDAISAAGDAGVLVVAAAGNSRVDIDQLLFSPASLDLPNLITVAAIDKIDRLAAFSNYGVRRCHVAAPGVDILSCDAFDDYGYLMASGTSMACPHVAGVAALVLAEHPGISVAELRERIVGMAQTTAALRTHVASGGRVDAFKAISAQEDSNLEVSVSFANAAGITGETNLLVLLAGHSNAVTITVHDLRATTNATVLGRFGNGLWQLLRNDGTAPDLRPADHSYSLNFVSPAETNLVVFSWEVSAPGKSPANGTVLLQPVLRPANDDFDRRQLLVGSHARVSGSYAGGTREPGEPWHNFLPIGNSVWYAWVAPTDGLLNLEITSEHSSPGATLYRGISSSSLWPVPLQFEPWHSLFSGSPYFVRSNFLYSIVVEDRRGHVGAFELKLDFYPGQEPALPPEFVVQPESRTVEEGTEFIFTSLARAASNIRYFWYFNGAFLQTSRDLVPRTAAFSHAGTYFVVASNEFGSVTSRVATLSVVPPTPTISHLFDDFEPDFDGTQWARIRSGIHATNYGGAVSGSNALCFDAIYANLSVLTRPVNTANGGMVRFWLRTGDYSSPNWRAPHPAVKMAFGFTAPLMPTVGVETFTPAYTWQRIEVPIPPEAQLTNAQFWWSAKSDDHFTGDWAIDDVEIVVRPSPEPPHITRDLPDVRVTQGTYWSASVGVGGGGPWTFHWYHNGGLVPLNNATTTFYGIGATNEAGFYFFAASNALGVVTSRVAHVEIIPRPTMAEALDITNVVLTIATNPYRHYVQWQGVIEDTHDGIDAWHLPFYGDDDFQPEINARVQGPGELSFWWKSAVDSGFTTTFSLLVNDEQWASVSGNSRWRFVRIELPEGEHLLRWLSFADDLPFSRANARVWLDEMRFVPAPQTAPAVVQVNGVPPFDQVYFTGTPHKFEVLSIGYNLTFQWMKNGTNIPEATGRWFTILSSTTTDSGIYSVLVSNNLGTTQSEPFVLRIIDPTESSSLLAQSLDTTNLIWTTSSNAPWISVTNTAHDGIDAARSPHVTAETHSWMQTEINGPGELSFWWKASTEAIYDQLVLHDNGRPVRYVDGETDWRLENVPLLPGTHVLRWTYQRDDTIRSGNDEVWVDEVRFTPGVLPGEQLGLALNQSTLDWSTDPVRPWFSQTNTHHDGISAVSSGMLDVNESNFLALNITGPVTLTFWWKLGSIDLWDAMWVALDGSSIIRIDGEIDWQRGAVTVPAGTHQVAWWYHHNAGYHLAQGQGWLDQVQVVTNAMSFSVERFSVESNGAATLSVTGPPGALAIIEASSDLHHWQPAATNFFSFDGNFRAILPKAELNSAQFFRARISSIH